MALRRETGPTASIAPPPHKSAPAPLRWRGRPIAAVAGVSADEQEASGPVSAAKKPMMNEPVTLTIGVPIGKVSPIWWEARPESQ